VTDAIDQISYADLYSRWEQGNWRATQLDFSQDRIDWRERFTEKHRRAALWNYALFLHGEDTVADTLSPYIDAAPREEQKYFLATQQVDEVRHAVFFARFMREVVEDGADSIGGSLDRSKPELTWGFRQLFALLERTADELRRDRSRPRLAAAVALYHFVVEATVAQTGQHFIDSYLERDGLLPGFHEGMGNVARDEQRHIAFGVKLVADLVREDPECKESIADVVREALQYAVALFIPPNWDSSYIELFGATLEDLYEQALTSLKARLRAAGIPLEQLPGAFPLPPDLSSREQAERGIKLVRANVLGERTGPPSRDPEIQALVFDAVRLSVDPRHASDGPTTIQWDFTDLQPWHLRIENGSTSAGPGRLEDPDLTLRCSYDDWVELAIDRRDPRLAVLTGKLRPRGKLRALWRAQSLFVR
jgi:ribonucleotide reductase beta subunit family protein with ferritin-like domain